MPDTIFCLLTVGLCLKKSREIFSTLVAEEAWRRREAGLLCDYIVKPVLPSLSARRGG